MATISIAITSTREGILTKGESELTLITDQYISAGDIINSPLYTQKEPPGPINLFVDEVVECRPSRGDWKTAPPTWMKIKYHKA